MSSGNPVQRALPSVFCIFILALCASVNAQELKPAFDQGASSSETQRAQKDFNYAVRMLAKGDQQQADGKARKARRSFDRAIEKLRSAARADTSRPDIFVTLGEAYDRNGDHRMAVGAYNYAIGLDPNLDSALRKRGLCLLELEMIREAQGTLEALRRLGETPVATFRIDLETWIDSKDQISERQRSFVEGALSTP